MSIKIAVDNTNVEQFPALNLKDIAACARKFADALEAGEFGEIESATVIVEASDGISSFHWGEAVSFYETIGRLELAKAHFMASIRDGGE